MKPIRSRNIFTGRTYATVAKKTSITSDVGDRDLGIKPLCGAERRELVGP